MKYIKKILLVLVLGFLGLSFCLSAKPNQEQSLIDSTTLQLMVVTTLDDNAVSGYLQRYNRLSAQTMWQKIGEPIPIVVGQKGLSWQKKEGDYKSPAGVFSLGHAFGFAAEKPAFIHLSYYPISITTECISDDKSRFYNQIVNRVRIFKPDWQDAEEMRAIDPYYRLGLIINYNTSDPKPGAGSCIFMHIWRSPTVGTAGCTAMSKANMKKVLAWLNPTAQPKLVQMPVAFYREYAKKYHLPN